MTRFRLVVWALMTTALCTGSASAAAVPTPWFEARTSGVTVFAADGKGSAERAALEFGRVMTWVSRALGGAPTSRRPILVFAVTGERQLRELLPQFWERRGQRPVAAYWTGPQQHYIVLRVDASERERRRRLIHEYVHLLAHERTSEPPLWLDEGVSELWAATRIDDDAIEIGRAPTHHLRTLRRARSWIPLTTLVAMNRLPDPADKKTLSLFYAQSWALAHFLAFGGSSPQLTFEPRAFDDAELPQVERALLTYVDAGQFATIRIPAAHQAQGANDGVARPEVRALSPAEALAVRAGALLSGERPAAARELLVDALALDPGEVTALEARGYLHFLQNEPVEAAMFYDRAIAIGRASHLAYYYRAILAGPVPNRADLSNGSGLSVQAEVYLRRSIELNPSFVEAYSRLSDEYRQRPDRQDEALPLLRRLTELEPGRVGHWLELARLLIRLNRSSEAREVGARGLLAVPMERSRGELETLLRSLDEGVWR